MLWASHSKSTVPERKKKRGLALFFLIAAVLFIAVAVSGVYSRNAQTSELQLRADKAARLAAGPLPKTTPPNAGRRLISRLIWDQNIQLSSQGD